jgi:hypothetical protein
VQYVTIARRRATRVQLCTSDVRFVNRDPGGRDEVDVTHPRTARTARLLRGRRDHRSPVLDPQLKWEVGMCGVPVHDGDRFAGHRAVVNTD